jgi:hypothetical protein
MEDLEVPYVGDQAFAGYCGQGCTALEEQVDVTSLAILVRRAHQVCEIDGVEGSGYDALAEADHDEGV